MKAAERRHGRQRPAGRVGGLAAAEDGGIHAYAVNREVVGIRALAVRRELARFAAAGWGDDRPGNHLQQAHQTAAVERNALDPLAADDGSHGGVLAVRNKRTGLDNDPLLHAAERQGEVEPRVLCDVEFDAEAHEGAEALFADEHLVDARLQRGERVSAIEAGSSCAPEAGVLMDQRDRRAGNH